MAGKRSTFNWGRSEWDRALIRSGALALFAAVLITAMGVGGMATKEPGSMGLCEWTGVLAALVFWGLGWLTVAAAKVEPSEPEIVPSVRTLDQLAPAVLALAGRVGYRGVSNPATGFDVQDDIASVRLVAEVEGVTVGYLSAWPDEPGLKVSWFLVDPAFPYEVIADALLDALAEEPNRQGYVASVVERDVVRLRLLERRGFVEHHRAHDSTRLMETYPGNCCIVGLPSRVVELRRRP